MPGSRLSSKNGGAEGVKNLQGRREVGREDSGEAAGKKGKMTKPSKSQRTFHSHQKIPEKTLSPRQLSEPGAGS